jgi:hypothetical protein
MSGSCQRAVHNLQIFLTDNRFIPVLKEMAVAMVALIEFHRITSE